MRHWRGTAARHAAGPVRCRPVAATHCAGKYVVAWLWLLLLLALTVMMPLLLAFSTQLDWGKLAAAALGVALLMGALRPSAWPVRFHRHAALAAGAAWLLSLGLWMVNVAVRASGERGGMLTAVPVQPVSPCCAAWWRART